MPDHYFKAWLHGKAQKFQFQFQAYHMIRRSKEVIQTNLAFLSLHPGISRFPIKFYLKMRFVF